MAQQVIVTGASSGIGRAAALKFGQAGASVLVVGRDGRALEEVAAGIRGAGGTAEVVEADVTSAQAPDLVVARAVETFGGLTTLVNAAGIIASGSIETTGDADWDVMMDVNARAPFRMMRAATPALVASR